MPGPMGNGMVRINKIDAACLTVHRQLWLLLVVQSSGGYLPNMLTGFEP